MPNGSITFLVQIFVWELLYTKVIWLQKCFFLPTNISWLLHSVRLFRCIAICNSVHSTIFLSFTLYLFYENLYDLFHTLMKTSLFMNYYSFYLLDDLLLSNNKYSKISRFIDWILDLYSKKTFFHGIFLVLFAIQCFTMCFVFYRQKRSQAFPNWWCKNRC